MDGKRRPRRNSSSCMDEVDEDGNVLWHGVKLGEFWKTDMQVAINDGNRRKDASFMIRVGKAGTTHPYQQSIPMDFARCYTNLFQESVTLEGPTGKTWTMVIRDFHNVVRFGKGWRQFCLENHLQERYQLLFTLVGKFRFLVQFFDHLGKRCTSYPPLPVAQPGSLPFAETQRRPGFQQEVDGGQASHRHGSEGQTSAAVPLMETTPNSAVPLNSDQDNVILRQYGPELPPEPSSPQEHMEELEEHAFNAWSGSEDMEIEDEGNEELEEAQNYIFLGSDTDDEVSINHPPATMQPLKKPERNIHTLNELSRGKQPKFHSPDNRAHSPQIQDHNNSPSSGDELPFQYYPEKQKKPVRAKRPSPVAPPFASYHETGSSSGSSPAMRVLQQQGCMRFSQIVLKCERRDVSDQERRVVVGAAKRFVSALENEKFSVVMRDEQVYHTFHLAIPENILEATRTKRASKVEVCLLDREQALYKTHWTRQNFCDTPLLDRDAWAKFAVDHTLDEGDVCVFQLLPKLPQSKPAVFIPAFLFCVHIFRVVETLVGQLNFSDAIDSE